MGSVTVTKKSEVFKDISERLGLVPEWMKQLPDEVVGPLWALMRDFDLAETKIPNKYKELIGIAVSGATRCRYCQLFHTECARLNGATDAEIAEAASVGLMTMAASTFINAMGTDFDEFRAETRKIVSYARQRAAEPLESHGVRV